MLFTIWTAVPSFLLPVQVQKLTGSTAVAALGLASTLGTIAATIGNPVLGQLSDRTRPRFGRRTPWLVVCALGGGAALLLQSAAPSITVLGIAHAATSLFINGFQAALTAVVPDRFPEHKINLASALVGVGLNAGVLAGSLIFVWLPDFAGSKGYYLMAALIVATAVIFALAQPGRRLPTPAARAFPPRPLPGEVLDQPAQAPRLRLGLPRQGAADARLLPGLRVLLLRPPGLCRLLRRQGARGRRNPLRRERCRLRRRLHGPRSAPPSSARSATAACSPSPA